MDKIWKSFLWHFCFWLVTLALLHNFIFRQNGWRYWACFMAIGLVSSSLQAIFHKLRAARQKAKIL